MDNNCIFKILCCRRIGKNVFKNLFVLCVALITIVTLSTSVSAEQGQENEKQIVQVVKFSKETNFENIVELALQQKGLHIQNL